MNKNLTELDKLKIAYEVIRDLESRDDIRGLKNAVTSVKNLLADDIAFAYTFGE
jgi:CO dehydrogenase/acetyl-CoA synthase gamma subunit (corrinoid Fe-S protein)